MTLDQIGDLPLRMFFPKNRLPVHFRDGAPIVTLNGVEQQVPAVEALPAKTAPAAGDTNG